MNIYLTPTNIAMISFILIVSFLLFTYVVIIVIDKIRKPSKRKENRYIKRLKGEISLKNEKIDYLEKKIRDM